MMQPRIRKAREYLLRSKDFECGEDSESDTLWFVDPNFDTARSYLESLWSNQALCDCNTKSRDSQSPILQVITSRDDARFSPPEALDFYTQVLIEPYSKNHLVFGQYRSESNKDRSIRSMVVMSEWYNEPDPTVGPMLSEAWGWDPLVSYCRKVYLTRKQQTRQATTTRCHTNSQVACSTKVSSQSSDPVKTQCQSLQSQLMDLHRKYGPKGYHWRIEILESGASCNQKKNSRTQNHQGALELVLQKVDHLADRCGMPCSIVVVANEQHELLCQKFGFSRVTQQSLVVSNQTLEAVKNGDQSRTLDVALLIRTPLPFLPPHQRVRFCGS